MVHGIHVEGRASLCQNHLHQLDIALQKMSRNQWSATLEHTLGKKIMLDIPTFSEANMRAFVPHLLMIDRSAPPSIRRDKIS
jgi:hypothetical protein